MGKEDFTRLESERLVLRRFQDSDLEPFLAYRNDPEVARYQSWESYGEREARAFIREMRLSEPGTPGEWFQFALELKQSGRLLGDCAMKTEEDGRQAEIGFTLSRDNQGRGFATEAVSRLLDYAFSDLGMHRVVAIADRENKPSVALLERLGMRREGTFEQNVRSEGTWASEHLYAVLKEEWLSERQEVGGTIQGLRISSEPHADPEEITFVREAIARHNVAVTRDTYYSPLAIFLRDDRDAIMGGAFGDIWGGWLELTLLWVAEPVRGRGYGDMLLRAAEEEAKVHGCVGVFLSTFSFQARPFYERHGYEVFGELPDYPAGHSHYFMKKTLEEPEPG